MRHWTQRLEDMIAGPMNIFSRMGVVDIRDTLAELIAQGPITS